MKNRYIKILVEYNELKIYLEATYAHLDKWVIFDNRKELLQYLNNYLNSHLNK